MAVKIIHKVMLHNITCFAVLLAVTIVKSEDVSLTIPLNKTLTVLNKELYGDFFTISSNSTVRVSLTNVNKKVNYIIFQVHSHLNNITLYQNAYIKKYFVIGTNVGLFGTVQPPDTYFVWNRNEIDVKVYISIHGYKNLDPIAGGCNMEYPTVIAPYMRVYYTKDNVSIETAAAQDPEDKKCNKANNVIFYRMYLNERDFGEDSYFEGIRKMITWGNIKENGYEVPHTGSFHQDQLRYLSAYPGTGSVYVAVAFNKDNRSYYSVYVPTSTYACSSVDGCQILEDYASQFFVAGLLFIGLFACFLGHRFFKTEMYLVGMFAGFIVTYIAISTWSDLDQPALLGASFLSGLFFGAIWILLWWFYGIPVLSVALTTMLLGFIVAAITYHIAPDGNRIFINDDAFWTIFISLMLCTCITLTTVSYIANIICCAILGAYAVVFSIDCYSGSNMKYIIINTIRRAIVKDFNKAVLAFPFQWKDALLTAGWIGLAVCGFLFQHYHNRGRRPFPPPPRSISRPLEPMTYGAIENRGTRRIVDQANNVDRASTVSESTPLLE